MSQPQLADRPVALVGPDERVWGTSPLARESGVRTQMTPRQAQTRCPNVIIQPLAHEACQDAQQVVLETLLKWGLPVEEQGWGGGYVNLDHVAEQARDVQPLAMQLGQTLRRELGQTLQSAIGWDSGKFTARAAACYTQPGRMKLVGKADEVRFLSPLSLGLLPLPPDHLQQLNWLGIHTLGQFAKLPKTAVIQRFGLAGQLAQQWAKGRDNRPVQATVHTAKEPIIVDIDPPSSLLPPSLDALLAALGPTLKMGAAEMAGVAHLSLDLRFVDGDSRVIHMPFIDPISSPKTLRDRIEKRLETLIWPDDLQQIRVTQLETREQTVQQMTLFDDLLVDGSQADPLTILSSKLQARFGQVFFQGLVAEAQHPLPERRSSFERMIS